MTSFPKPERATRKAAKRRLARTFALTRAQVRSLVYTRARGRCERCQRPVSFDVAGWRDDRAQVNETTPRSLGGDPLKLSDCELVCKKCHFGGPSGAHAPRQDRMVQR